MDQRQKTLAARNGRLLALAAPLFGSASSTIPCGSMMATFTMTGQIHDEVLFEATPTPQFRPGPDQASATPVIRFVPGDPK